MREECWNTLFGQLGALASHPDRFKANGMPPTYETMH
jgi:hypothetical protein